MIQLIKKCSLVNYVILEMDICTKNCDYIRTKFCSSFAWAEADIFISDSTPLGVVFPCKISFAKIPY